MKTWIKRLAALALIAAGAVLFVRHVLKLLDWPHLYPDLGELQLENLIYLGLTLLLTAFAWIAAAYLLLNAKERILHLLIPAAAFGVLLLLSGVCAAKAVGDIPCTNTSSLAAFREDFDSESFRVRGKALYPGFPMGELTGYSRYEKGEVLAESVTRTFDQEGFSVESMRLSELSLPAFRPEPLQVQQDRFCAQMFRLLFLRMRQPVPGSVGDRHDAVARILQDQEEASPVPSLNAFHHPAGFKGERIFHLYASQLNPGRVRISGRPTSAMAMVCS